MTKRNAATLFTGIVGVLIISFGTIYAVAQQMQRNEADYSQIQLAEDTAASLNAGNTPAQLTYGHVDMSHSLASFIVIYSHSGQPITGNGYLDNKLPAAPIGILQAANGSSYHRVTWQPTSNVRIATVTVAANNYYVLSGRSLTEVEKTESQTFWLCVMGGIASIAVTVAVFAALCRPHSSSKRS